jgi:RecA/RadA recombinase
MSHIPYYNQPDTESKRMNKNGYEIRAELVAVAKDYIEKQHATNVEYANKMLEVSALTTQEYLNMLKPYTFESILEHANKMYEFVASKK